MDLATILGLLLGFALVTCRAVYGAAGDLADDWRRHHRIDYFLSV